MKKTIISIILLLVLISCSRTGIRRFPASADPNCSSLLGEVFSKTSPSHLGEEKLLKLEESVSTTQEKLNLEDHLYELAGEIYFFDNRELENSMASLMGIFEEYKSSPNSFASYQQRWDESKLAFFEKWRTIEADKSMAPPKSKVKVEAQSIVNELRFEKIEVEDLIERRASIIHGIWAKGVDADEAGKSELVDFTYWLFSKNNMDDIKADKTLSNINMWLEEYRGIAKEMSKSTRKNMIIEGKKNILTLHNELIRKSISQVSDPDELKRQALIYLETFSLLEPKFDQQGFIKYLINQNSFEKESIAHYQAVRKAEGIDIDLGMILRDQYQRFAPYQNNPAVFNKSFTEATLERTRELWDKLSKKQKSCHDLDCYNKEARNGWLDIFKLQTYKKTFSCLRNNPVVLKSMAMDLGLVWGGLTWYYLQNKENFQRFPMEIMINGAAFAPIIAEANCRSTFKGDLAFGTPIPEKEVIINGLTKTKRTFKKFRGVAFKGFISSVGLLSLTTGLDHLFLALGHQVASPLSINDIAALLPISFLYHGVWSGVKSMAIMNPIRHKFIPRLAKAIAKKTRLPKSYWPLQTGLDFGAYHAFSALGRWDYMIFYSSILLPFIKENVGVGHDLDHKEELIKEDITEHTYTSENELGVKTKVVIVEDKNGVPAAGAVSGEEASSGTIQVMEAEIDVPDKVLEDWADKVISSYGED